ncbi:MAG: hypothetical protein Q8L49_13700 [Burkholderiaceae bacterium]|nr:hypothetical protein [Burkholderiaceae bacterium]
MLWLEFELRFPGAYRHIEYVLALRSQLSDGIERQLAQMRNRQRRAR